jgi:hypothetical protein
VAVLQRVAASVLSSTPVLPFGDFTRAEVATLGLNPSKNEFLVSAGELLVGPAARFETLASLGVKTLSSVPSVTLKQVVSGCSRYFQRNPYWRWFAPLEDLLQQAARRTRKAPRATLISFSGQPIPFGES